MAQNQMQGLFKGPGVNDVYALQRQERDQKVRQAMADSAGAGGNFYANIQAKANEQMSQALQGGVRGLLQGTDLAPAEDPRLAAARKREGDRNDINQMLAGFKSDDGKISEDELKQGYAELMSRGYPNEAASFLQQAQSMRKLDIDSTKANAALQKAINSSATNLGKEVKSTHKLGQYDDPEGKPYTKILSVYKDGTTEELDIYADGSRVDSAGLTAEGGVNQAYKVESANLWAKNKDKMAKSVGKMGLGLAQAKRALELLPKIKTGGMAVLNKGITDFLGTTPANVGEFNNVTGQVIIQKIGEFGANPTEGERKFLAQVEAGLSQGKQVNEAILKQLIKIYQGKLDRTSKHLGMDYTQYHKSVSEGAKEMSEEAQSVIAGWGDAANQNPPTVAPRPDEADLNIGDELQSPNGLLRWNGSKWDRV